MDAVFSTGTAELKGGAMFASHVRSSLSAFFGAPRSEEYLARYVLRECCHRGRPLREVLRDPYVANRSTPEERARLLDAPEVVEALGGAAIADARRWLDAWPPSMPPGRKVAVP